MMENRFGAVPRLSSPWEVYAGDDCGLELRLVDDGEPANLDGVTVRAAWRASRDSVSAVELTVEPVEDTPGTVLVKMEGAKTAVESGMVRDGVFDVQLERDGYVTTILTGAVRWVKDVTR